MAKQYDLIIVGAGMVGSLAALLLADSSLRIALVDKHSGDYVLSTPPSYDARVSAISCQSKALLESAGAWQKIPKERLAVYNNMVVWDGLGEGYIDFNARKTNLPELG
ncbi:FAD-dependent monooxygenase, partial [Polaribacter sp. 20A6]